MRKMLSMLRKMLMKKSELISKCRHLNKQLLRMSKKSSIVVILLLNNDFVLSF